ncbi:MAG: hypothetical protein ABIJ09_27330 [Pseudomonadota bacterium]
MWFECDCGREIKDNGDGLSYKARWIADEDWCSFWDAIDDAVEKSGPTPREKTRACLGLRKKFLFKALYQCPDCGRVHVDGDEDDVLTFEPDDENDKKHILSRTRRDED